MTASQIAADVARTYDYLVDMSERLRQYLEAQAVRAAVTARTSPDRETEDAAARQREAMADAEANRNLDLLAKVA